MKPLKIFSIWLLIILLCLTGCGGGTSGTGGNVDARSAVYRGTIINEAGQPVSQVVVTLVDTGETQTTSSDGKFEFLSLDSLGELIEITINYAGYLKTLQIDGLNSEQTNTKITIRVDLSGNFEVIDIEY